MLKMPRSLITQLSTLLLVLFTTLTQPALAQLPDPTLFRVRIELGDVDKVREWLQAGLSPDFEGDQVGTGLMLSAWEGQIPLMELFVARGANVNRSNAAGEQALMHAAWRGNLEAVKWLLAHGAQLNREPLQWTALHYAVFAGKEDVAQYLIERGADINARSANGSTPLMMAAYEGHEPLARRLVALGADTGVRNDRGEGALDWAMKYGRLGIARVVADRQQFASAASLPREHWGNPVRSVSPEALAASTAAGDGLPASVGEIELLMEVRGMLAARGMTQSLANLDRQIAALKGRTAEERRPATILEISAERTAPREQQARLVSERRVAQPKPAARPKAKAPARPVVLDRSSSRTAR